MQLEEVVRSIPTLAVDSVFIAHQSDKAGEAAIAWVNDAFCDMFTVDREAAMGLNPIALFHHDYTADFLSAVEEMTTAGKTNLSQDTLCLRCDGSSFWGGVSYVEIEDDSGTGRYTLTFVRDIDDLKNREQSAELALIEHEHLLNKVEAAQTRLMSALSISPDPFAIFDARDRLVIWNPAFADIVSPDQDAVKAGMKKDEVISAALGNGYFDDAVGREEEFLQNYLSDWEDGFSTGFVIRIKGRDYKVIRSKTPNGDRVVLRVDITEQLRQQRELSTYAERLEEANREISQQALHDELTGLGNRRYLNARLEEMIKEREQSGQELAALHIDLDRFKHVNDTMGHAAGDHVLQAVAAILKTKVRQNDTAARIGGDEFVVLMHCTPGSEIPELLADRLIEEICKPIEFENRPCRIGASVGIARTPMIPAADLLTCSDIALYKAKSGGRAMKAVFDHSDLESMKSLKRLGDDILRGLDEGEFVPVYQPQIDAESGRVVALEVLVRWDHPERGLLSPGDFLTTAFEIQAENALDAMVFKKAIEECRVHFEGWEDPPVLAFNVSLSRLMQAELVESIRDLAYPGKIAFELVETVFLEEEQSSFFERIEKLRAEGVTFEVDNFGSGRASIVGLRRIGPERLKIDRRLIEPITTSESASRLVQSIIDIGRALEIEVTAEGVETAAHAEELKQLGCDRMQGFHFARPLPLQDVIAMTKDAVTDKKARA